jgi:hypothetical protein
VPAPVDPLIELKARNAELAAQVDVLNAALDAQAIVNRDLTSRITTAAKVLVGTTRPTTQP